MATVTVSAVINRPVEGVFAFLTDARNFLQWQSNNGLQRAQQSPESPVGVGTRVTEVWKFMGVTSESTSEVTEYEPNRKYSRHSLSDGSPIKDGTWTFEPVAGGAQVTSTVTVKAGGLFAIAEPLLVANLKRGFEENLYLAKRLLEQQTARIAR
ncbi:MAG: SRPBCC family protein [Ktedonobacterales bacterium]